MSTTATVDVQHGLNSWVDFDRPWLFRRQFLVSDRTASILTNLVAMALTMAGPRLWILIKAFFFWAIGFYERRCLSAKTGHVQSDLSLPTSSSIPINPNQQDIPLRNLAISEGCATIKNSHSELGAALDLFKGVLSLLKLGRIELSTIHSSKNQRQTSSKIRKIWNNFLRQPLDILIPLLISVALIGLFVAQSSGSVLSASIISDTTALSLSSKCPLQKGDYGFYTGALEYVKKCYHAKHGADGCNDFYNQTIAYTEKSNETCPFLGQTCVWGKKSALALDTGFIDAKFLGINAAKRYQFRRKTLCAPLIPDDHFIKLAPPREVKDGHGGIDLGAEARINEQPGMLHNHRSSYSFSRPEAIDPIYFPGKSFDAAWVTIFEISTRGMKYPEFRDDPVFPAMHKQYNTEYVNNSTIPGILGCVDNAYIYDPDRNQTLDWPEASQKRTLRFPTSLPFKKYDDVVTNADLAGFLLSSAIYRAFSRRAFTGFLVSLEAKTHCDDLFCRDLPREQWKVEARQLFETSLADLQYAVLDIVRANRDEIPKSPPEIPPKLRGICRMGKFKSVGWRNVSAFGLIGLLFLSGAISLASVKTENDELWLIVGAHLLIRALRWGMRSLSAIPWASTSNRILHFISTFPKRRAGVASQPRSPA